MTFWLKEHGSSEITDLIHVSVRNTKNIILSSAAITYSAVTVSWFQHLATKAFRGMNKKDFPCSVWGGPFGWTHTHTHFLLQPNKTLAATLPEGMSTPQFLPKNHKNTSNNTWMRVWPPNTQPVRSLWAKAKSQTFPLTYSHISSAGNSNFLPSRNEPQYIANEQGHVWWETLNAELQLYKSQFWSTNLIGGAAFQKCLYLV